MIRVAYTRPLRKKTAEETAMALESIITALPMIPRNFCSDDGSEFKVINGYIYYLLIGRYNMNVYVLKSDVKGSIIERFNRTLKSRIERYFTEHNTKNWIDILDQMTSNYNNTEHRSIGMPPMNVSYENRAAVFRKLYPNRHIKVKCKLNHGDRVRIALKKNIFSKGYKINWSEEIYTIDSSRQSGGICYYTVKSTTGETLDKTFYNEQLNLVLRHDKSL